MCANTALAYDCNLGCVCPLNMMLNSLTAGGKCVCDRYSLLIGTTCTRCPQGMQADYLRVRCIPALGYYLASSGNIAKIPICSLFAYFNEQT